MRLDQVISRHHPEFSVAGAQLGLGRDGNVYLANGSATAVGQAMCFSLDGALRGAGAVGYATGAVTANAAGLIATAESHLPHRVCLWDQDFTLVTHLAEFTTNNNVGWAAPSDVVAGPSGDFYAIDQHVGRVVRVGQNGALREAYPLGQLGEVTTNAVVGLRVCEPLSLLCTAWPSGQLCMSTVDGEVRWRKPLRPSGSFHGGYDLTDDGHVYVHAANNLVEIFDAAGNAAGSITLTTGADFPITGLRVHGTELIVKREDPTTLFEVYQLATGERLYPVAADTARLTVEAPSEVWIAGEPTGLTITHDPGGRPAAPALRAWLRPLGVPEFTELGATVPAAARGLYHLRVSPDGAGRLNDYTVDGVVEVRVPDSQGSVSIFTPLNRFYYGRGEAIEVTVLARSASAPLPTSVTVRIVHDGQTVGTRDVVLRGGTGSVTLDAAFTAGLATGRYVLDAEVAGFTVAPQYLDLGVGLAQRPTFHLVQHGDYEKSIPDDPRQAHPQWLASFADLPDLAEDHLNRAGVLGLNLFADRLAFAWTAYIRYTEADPATVERLKGDPAAVTHEKAVFEDATRRTVAGYGARGMEEHPILLDMDTEVPLTCQREEEYKAALAGLSKELLPYPAFRGWSWAANWWLTRYGAEEATDPVERGAYDAALEAASATGGWDPVLDTVTDRSFAYMVDLTTRFRATLNEAAPGKISAITGPYRKPQSHPPVLFAGADEVDLHYQSEQIQPPQVTAHQVDFYRRPGKPVWGRPELTNDDGTGGMYLPTLFQMAMRGPNGLGQTGSTTYHAHAAEFPDARSGGAGPKPGDPRSGGAGKASVLRAAYAVLGRYGAAMAEASNDDRVAIVVSTRMARIGVGQRPLGSAYFETLFEAYNACLYAHRPASFVFTEDVSAEALSRFSAVLVVGQRVRLDPVLDTALRAAGVPVYFDGTCRAELLSGFTQLEISFDRVHQDPSAWQDDSAYARFRQYFIGHAAALREAWNRVVPPVAGCDEAEVLLSERVAGETRYLWAVNNTMLDLSPGQMWRVNLLMTNRVPVIAELDLIVPSGHKVVDLLAGEVVANESGTVTADLRTVPARLYAIVPADHPVEPERPQDGFGPHVRDIAVSADGTAALLTTFNWDHNLYAIDLATGETTARAKVGHHFTYAPATIPGGYAVQGFDLPSAEGYHLYLTDGAGVPARRFALFGLPKRATDWAVAEWAYDAGLNNFAVAPSGSWVASSGDLGLAVWDSAGTERWTHEWWTDRRTPHRLLAQDDDTLITLSGRTATALNATDGSIRWTLALAVSGTISGGLVAADRRTVLVWTDTEGGRLYVIRDGAVVNTIATALDEVAISADGTFAVATSGRRLTALDLAGGPLWTFTGDDFLRRPTVSADGARVAVGSELGTLTVLGRDGVVQAQQDLRALPVPVWLADGDLLVATWMGRVTRFDPGMQPRWQRLLAPTETDVRPKLLAPDPTPVSRKTGWGNATETPLELTPNLLAETSALVYAVRLHGGKPAPLASLPLRPEDLRDGKTDPLSEPGLPWHEINGVDSGWWDKLTIVVDAFHTQLRLTGVTIAEDTTHPESWWRDVRLQWWDVTAEQWRDGPYLLSDAAVHSHVFAEPIEAARFRFVSTGGGAWPAGNLWLSELVFHGETIGCSHPDVQAGNARAVLFDEQESDLRTLIRHQRPFDICTTDGFNSRKSLRLFAAGDAMPDYQLPFGHWVPNWDFEIAENPQRGQYRYLRFAWKALSSATAGMALAIGQPWDQSCVVVKVGEISVTAVVLGEYTVLGKPVADWTTVTVDLWAITNGNPPRIRCLYIKSDGDGALFDQLVLGRTEADLSSPS